MCLRTDTQVCPLGRIVASELRVADDVSAEEGENLTFTVELSPASEVFAGTVTVDWATSEGTATSGTDFSAGSGTLTFAPGVTEQTFTVATIEDMTDEDHETFTVTLSNATSAAISGATATGTIENDDWPPLAWSTTLTVGNDFLAVEHYGYHASTGSLSTDEDFEVQVGHLCGGAGHGDHGPGGVFQSRQERTSDRRRHDAGDRRARVPVRGQKV
ncbi:Calx-beta domain-containing protein [Candidatus Palauibacter sp.]|uniref:Calx-beta domain-containing protein n=1 Tax=Candidatus Palauibacter sp. TaxID=3101350 RepID=UPI003B5BC89A